MIRESMLALAAIATVDGTQPLAPTSASASGSQASPPAETMTLVSASLPRPGLVTPRPTATS